MSASRTPWSRRALRGLAALVVGLTALTLAGPAAQAATPTFTLPTAAATVSGTTVSVTATFKASSTVTVSSYSVCVRGSANANYDFTHKLNSGISTTGTAYTATRTIPAGTYKYYGCVKYNGTWYSFGAARTFTVAAAAAAGSTSTSMPTGDLPGWKQVFAEDFTTAVPLGSWNSSSYAKKWFGYSGYADTSGRGWYDPNKVISVQNGAMDWYVRTEGGQRLVAAMVPRIPASNWGQTYGRYSFRFKADTIPGYKMVGILWPDSDNWGEGEIDFPEVNNLVSTEGMYANMYRRGNTTTKTPGAASRFQTTVAANGTGWHIATIEWAPNSLTYYLDGTKLGTFTDGVPSTSFHLVFQVETKQYNEAPAADVAGHVQIDWLTMYSRA